MSLRISEPREPTAHGWAEWRRSPLGTAATLLADGKVLITGGAGHKKCVEIYDPDSGSFTLTGFLKGGRFNHTATLLPNGNVLIVGGELTHGVVRKDAEVYDPSVGGSEWAPGLKKLRTCHSAFLLPSGRVLIFGGRAYDPDPLPPGIELYDPTTGVFEEVVSEAVYAFVQALLLPNGEVFSIVGPEGGVRLYDTVTGDWRTLVSELTVYRGGGFNPVLLPDGRVLITGGHELGTGPEPAIASAEIWDPESEMFVSIPDMGRARVLHTTTLLSDGRVLVVGGQTQFIHPASPVLSAELLE